MMNRPSLLITTLREYSERCGLHGVRYLGESGRPWPERLLWTLGILLSLLGISCLILKSWQQWTQSPVLVSFADTPLSIWNIPFPTITICPPNKYRKSVFDMSKFWNADRGNMSDRERKSIDDLMLVCRSMSGSTDEYEEHPLFTDDETVRNIIEMAPSLYDSVECLDIMGTTNQSTCDWMIDTVLTREGVCFSYNALPRNGIYNHSEHQIWFLEGGYDAKSAFSELPRRATGAGFLQGILILLKINSSELDYNCRPLQWVKITLTNPADVPRPMDRAYLAPTRGVTQMSISPHVTDTEDALKSYSPQQRQCYFQSERRLAYFATYTQYNCELECLTNYTYRACGCVDFYMPHNSSTPICAFKSVVCVLNAERLFIRELINKKIHKQKSKQTCGCLPSCKSIEFTAEISQMDINAENVNKFLRIDQNETFKHLHLNFIYINLKDSDYLPIVRRELYGMASFIASCGGLLGLCCGFSILSLLELIYFFTMRLWNNFGNAESSKRTRRIEVIPRPFYLQ